MVERIRAAGGEVYGISSEPQTLAGRARPEWDLDFETHGDPHHDIVGTCRERGWLELYVNPELDFLRQSVAASDVDFSPTHPKGYFQPGVLVLDRAGRVLYRWRGVPTHKNMGGATERPTAAYVWTQIEAGLADTGGSDAVLDAAPELDSKGIPWALFSSLLIANGWFVRPRGFRGAPYIVMAALRLLAFVAAWIAAFAWLPTLPVALALGAYVAYIVPKFRWVGRQFQDVSASRA